jgi:hypothetical protein
LKNIVENLIDKQGNKAFTQCLLVVIYLLLYTTWTICSLGLISSYPRNKVLIESKVVNFKEEGMLGSTVDFKAIYPVTAKDGTEQNESRYFRLEVYKY